MLNYATNCAGQLKHRSLRPLELITSGMASERAIVEPTTAFNHESALAACARGERDALRAIYEYEIKWLLGVAYRIVRRREGAHDVVHDAFIQIWRKAHTYDPSRGNARGWIYSVVRNRALSVIRQSGRETLVDGTVIESLAEIDDDSLEKMMRTPDATALARCLGQLDPPKRSCIVAAYVDGLSHQQIAAHLKTPLGTVKTRIQRALVMLRDCMS